MSERERKDERLEIEDAPGLSRGDWDDIGKRGVSPTDAHGNGDLRFKDDPSGDLPGEDDDNEYQESDEALPDDEEERAIERNPGKEGGRFDEV